MSAASAHMPAPAAQVKVSRSNVLKRIVTNPLAVPALLVLAVIVASSVFAPLLAPFDPNYSDISSVLQTSSDTHPLGTDGGGRDVLSRLLFAGQVTLLAAVLAAVVAIGIGVPAGLMAGYYGGAFDSAANWITNMLMSLPGIIVLLAVRAALGPSVWVSMIVFGVLLSPSFYRLTRTAVRSVRNELYVDAAKVSGLSDGRIMTRHVFSVVRAPIIIQTAMVSGIAIAIQSGLEFLGLGDPTVPTWGVMLSEGFRNAFVFPQLMLWPGLAIALTTVSLAVLGNAVRDALEDGQKAPGGNKSRKKPAQKKTAAAGVDVPIAAPVIADPVKDSNHLLTVDGLGVGYPQAGGTVKHVVNGVSLHVEPGEVLGIVGESGSGKSQTAFSVLGLLPETAQITGGSIRFKGKDLVAHSESRMAQSKIAALRGKGIAYIPQEPMSNLDPAFTIGYQLVRPMVKVLGISNPQRTFDAYPHEVSGGMAQRVLIAGAVSCEPDLLIADEPTTALDVTVQAEVLDLLRDLQKRLGMGMIMVTHNFGVVADICDRVAVMQHGVLVEEGDVRSILRSPQHPYTRQLLDSTLEGKEPMTLLTTPKEAAEKETARKEVAV
jgi:ABC-type dipeptide/oligopeptide/nickel transport system ATPase component/ABC-type dipeptide/oligopeptide/nickel transport system permease subunit